MMDFYRRWHPLPLLVAVIIAVLAVVMLRAGAAEAQTVDVRPTVNAAIDWLAGAALTVFTALGGFALRWIMVRIGLENSKLERDLQERLDFIVHKAIDYAVLTAQNEVAKRGAGLGAVKVDNWLIKVAADTVQKSAPAILEHFELDREAVERLVISRISAALPVPVTPEPIAGGLASPPLAKEATREVGAPASARAAVDPGPVPNDGGFARARDFQDAPGTIG